MAIPALASNFDPQTPPTLHNLDLALFSSFLLTPSESRRESTPQIRWKSSVERAEMLVFTWFLPVFFFFESSSRILVSLLGKSAALGRLASGCTSRRKQQPERGHSNLTVLPQFIRSCSITRLSTVESVCPPFYIIIFTCIPKL